MHPKLSSVEQRTGGMTHEERLERLKTLMKDDPPKSPASPPSTVVAFAPKAYKP